MNAMTIDTTLDFRTELPPGRDPDLYSPTLRRYHKLLWSKPLPCGCDFGLSDATPRMYLHHRSNLGEYRLTSDGIGATFTMRSKPETRKLLEQFSEDEHEDFRRRASTIAGFLIFPANIAGQTGQTINQVRGCNLRISDRIDLTLECIRLHYLSLPNPLGATLSKHADFLALFGSFTSYVDFFLLNDLTSADSSTINFFLPLNFEASGMPKSADEYRAYRQGMLAFLDARSRRIAAYAANLVDGGGQGIAEIVRT